MPQEVRAISLNMTSEIGADDALIYVKVVPESRDGLLVYGRTPLPEEQGLDLPIIFYPENGEELHFKQGSIKLSIMDIDKHASKYSDGYASITNTLWTWLSIGQPTSIEIFRLIMATGHRLDATHSILADILKRRDNIKGSFITQRECAFEALSLAEIFVVVFSKSINLSYTIKKSSKSITEIPIAIKNIKKSVDEMRNAFEHIESRAFGRVKNKNAPEVVSIFDQGEFISRGILSYLGHKIDLVNEVPKILINLREYLFKLAIEIGGNTKICSQDICFFNTNNNTA